MLWGPDLLAIQMSRFGGDSTEIERALGSRLYVCSHPKPKPYSLWLPDAPATVLLHRGSGLPKKQRRSDG